MHFESQNGICMYKPAIYHKDSKKIDALYCFLSDFFGKIFRLLLEKHYICN